MHQGAINGYKAYIRAYASHSLKEIFNVNNLDRQKVALSFGLTAPPHVTLGESDRHGWPQPRHNENYVKLTEA